MLSHEAFPDDLESVLSAIRARVVEAGDQPHATISEMLEVLAQLAEFPFGRFLLVNRGWNGYWTHQAVVYHPQVGRARGADEHGRPYTPLEARLLDLPLCRSTQERFTHFQRLLQAQVRGGVRMGSLPCGLMDDLLGLDFSGVDGFRLCGIDLDAGSLRLAALGAERRGLRDCTSFHLEDGWACAAAELDVLTSNGLNIYEPSDARILDLYRAFRQRLVRGGTLITSFLTPVEAHDVSQLQPEELRLQRIIFGDLVAARFSVRRSAEATCAQLEAAGFEVAELVYDRARAFPTVRALAR